MAGARLSFVVMNNSIGEITADDEYQSFNVLGKTFLIRIDDLRRYPNTLLSDTKRLEIYWHDNLNAYFFSRDIQIFENIILPFYTSSTDKIRYSSTIFPSKKLFQDELAFYDLLEYYQNDNILDVLVDNEQKTFDIISLLHRQLIHKCLCRCIHNIISCISCMIGICEMILWKCNDRMIAVLLIDTIISLILLWTLFYEQSSDNMIFPIRLTLISSCESVVFMMEMIFSSMPFIISLLSYKNKNIWYYTMGICFRHLLLIRLCLPDFCHLIDIICYNGRLSFDVFSKFLLFFLSISFLCIWIGITIYITDSQDHLIIQSPSHYIYFVYHILLNVGYGDVKEESILSFIILLIMTSIGCSILIIMYENLIVKLNNLRRKLIHVETCHHQSFLDDLIIKIQQKINPISSQ